MAKKIKIAVADDQTMFRSGLVSLLNDIDNVIVEIEAVDGEDLLEQMKEKKVDIVFLDYRMPNMNGLAAAKIIRETYPYLHILMLSMYHESEFIIKAIENGANGYLTKDDEPDEIKCAIDSVLNTGYYVNDRVSKLLVGHMMMQGKIFPKFKTEGTDLTIHEIEVIQLIAKELSSKEIADRLNKSERTIEGYRASIMEKTNAKNLVGIVMYGIKVGIITP